MSIILSSDYRPSIVFVRGFFMLTTLNHDSLHSGTAVPSVVTLASTDVSYNPCYGCPLSVSGRLCYILPMFLFIYLFFYGRLILRPWLTEVRESFTRGGP